MYLIIFDVDGTLIDSQAVIVESVQEAFRQCDEPVPGRGAILDCVGLSLVAFMERLRPELPRDMCERLALSYKNAYSAARERGVTESFYPGLKGVLQKLTGEDDFLLAIATGKSIRGVDHIFGTAGLLQIFQSIQTADTNPSKPHPGMIHKALSDTGIDPDRAIMIGDTSFDMEMGKAAGVSTLAVTWGYHNEEDLRQVEPSGVVHSAEDLLQKISALTDNRDLSQ